MSHSKLNADETDLEVLVMGIPQMRAKISILCNNIKDLIVRVLNEPVGNMGAVFFKQNMTMSANYISKVIKSADFHLRIIGKIRKLLNIDNTKSAIVSLVTSRIDYCNGIICGITHEPRCRLQKVQTVPLE